MTPERVRLATVAASDSADPMEAELQLIAELYEQPLRVALHALPLVMVVRHDEVLDGGCLRRELLRSLTDAPLVPGAHEVVRSTRSPRLGQRCFYVCQVAIGAPCSSRR